MNGTGVAKEPLQGAIPKEPASPCSWIKSLQREDNEIQEKTETLKCWKIICSEPNPAFQNTLTEPEFTLGHNSISQGLYLCFKAQPQKVQFQNKWWLWHDLCQNDPGLQKLRNSKSFWIFRFLYSNSEAQKGELMQFFRLQWGAMSKTGVCITPEQSSAQWTGERCHSCVTGHTRLRGLGTSLSAAVPEPCSGEHEAPAESESCMWSWCS